MIFELGLFDQDSALRLFLVAGGQFVKMKDLTPKPYEDSQITG